MKTVIYTALLALAMMAFAGCGKKKQSEDIITQKVEAPKLQPPVKMQEYTQTKDVDWLSRKYQVQISRMPSDSLPMVKDETGQKFVDNRISLRISRQDGSVFFSRVFTKADFLHLLDKDYRETGILEGLVYDKVENNHIYFASSVCHPQTDEITIMGTGHCSFVLPHDICGSPFLRHLVTLCAIGHHIWHDGITKSPLILIHQNWLTAMMYKIVLQVATKV